MADIKNFGIKGIASDVQLGKSGGRLRYDSSNNRFDLTQSDGSTLEDLRVGNVTSGGWTATAIGTAYGGLGQDLSSSTGTITISNGTATAGTLDLGNVEFVSGTLSVSNGGTGATTDSGARTALGIGSIGTQASDSVALTGGTLDGIIIGGSSPAAITGSSITSTTGFVGDLTGAVTGNVTGNLTGAVTGNVTGNLTGDVTGDVTGDLTGDVTGNTAGTHTGPVTGAVTGNVSGNVTGDLTGNSAGTHTGPVTGVVTGNVTGDVTGSLTGDSSGTHTGASNGLHTGNVVGNVTGDLTGTADSADALSSAVTVAVAGDMTGSASFSAAGATASITTTLASTGVSAATYGTSTTIPVLTVDAKGRVTAASTVSLATGFTLAADSGSADSFAGGETVTFKGTTNQLATTVTDNQIEIGFAANPTINNLTATGTFTSDDITSAQINIDGDATITGNLTVQGATTTVESTTVQTADAIFRTNSNGLNTDSGFEANTASGVKQILYKAIGTKWDFGSEAVKATSFEGNLVGNVTGNLTGDVGGNVVGNVTGNLTGAVTGTTVSASAGFTGALTGDVTGDTAGTHTGPTIGNITGNSAGTHTGPVTGDVSGNVTGVLTGDSNGTHTGPVTGAVTGNVSGNVTGNLTGDSAGTHTGAVSGNVTGDLTGDVTGTVSSIANHSTSDLTEGTRKYYTDARVATKIDSYVTGGTGVSIASGVVSLDATAVTAATYGAAGTVPVFTVDAQGRVTSVTDTSLTSAFTFTGDSGAAKTISTGDTLSFAGGTNLNSVTSSTGDITFNLDSDISINSITVTGAGGLSSGNVSILDQDIQFHSNVARIESLSTGALSIEANLDIDIIANDSIINTPTNDFRVAAGDDVDITADDQIWIWTNAGGTGGIELQSQSQGVANGVSIKIDNESGNLTGDVFNVYGVSDVGYVSINSTVAVTGIIDDDSFGTASAVTLATSESIKAYVDSKASASDLDFQGDTGGALSIDLETEVLDIAGGTGISTVGSGNTLTVSLDNTAVTAAQYGSATTIPQFTVDAQGRVTAAASVALQTDFLVAADSGSADTVTGGQTLTFAGGTGIDTVVSDNQISIAIADAPTINDLTVTGTFTSDDITSASISVNGDTIITGNLTVQGTQTIVNSTTVEASDPIFRVNSDGTAGTDVGLEANVSGVMKQIVYLGAGSKWSVGSETFVAQTFEGNLTGNVTGNLTGDLTGDIFASDTTSKILDAGTDGTDATITATLTGNVTGNVTGNLTGNSAGVHTGNVTGDVTGNLSGATVTATGAISFGSLTDGTDTITGFITQADQIISNDNDATLPTSAAVRDYVDERGGDGLALRGTFTANSSDQSFSVGTMPNATLRTYYADKIVIKVGTAFSGGSVNAIKILDGNGTGTVLCDIDDADVTTAGTYSVELDGETALTKNQTIDVKFFQADTTTPATSTAGACTVTVHYKYV
jgi:hypothetical protein